MPSKRKKFVPSARPTSWANGAQGFSLDVNRLRGTRWRSWLRHCATSRKVAGSIPEYLIYYLKDYVIDIIHPPALWPLCRLSPLTKMNTRNISCEVGVKATGAWGWLPYHLHIQICLEILGASTSCKPSGDLKDIFTFYLVMSDIFNDF